MPIAPSPKIRLPRALVVGMVAVLIGIGVVVGLLQLSKRGDIEVNVGDNAVLAGNVQERLKEIEAGGPIIYGDPNESDASIYLQSLTDQTGGDGLAGSDWTAFRAHRFSNGVSCPMSLVWEPAPQIFRDPCDDSVIINADGCLDLGLDDTSPLAELRHYGVRVSVENNSVIIDLNSPDDSYCPQP